MHLFCFKHQFVNVFVINHSLFKKGRFPSSHTQKMRHGISMNPQLKDKLTLSAQLFPVLLLLVCFH